MLPVVAALLCCTPAADTHPVGVARVDVTPKFAVRLSGFGFRRAESDGVHQRIWAKALAFGTDDPAVLLTVDNLGVSAAHVAELAKRLAGKGVRADRLAVTATHTHTAPMLAGVCPTLFGVPIPQQHLDNIDRYTREFLDNLEKAALAALADRKPATLHYGVGTVTFAINRRGGRQIDHDLPLLVVREPGGKVRAAWVNYACHCVTLSHNKIGGDWAGHAQQAIEDDHPGAVALVSIGAGADQNPSSGVTGDKVEIASRQGLEIAREVKRLLGGYLAPVSGPLSTTSRTIDLPLQATNDKARWEKLAEDTGAVGHHARVQLARLKRGESIRSKIDYRVQTWAFGSSLAVVFLPGEVVVDYSLRLKKELDCRRLWVTAYANDAPCYIPSERVLKEGGYEGGGAMIYYDVPQPFKPGLEDKIVGEVKAQLGTAFPAALDAARTGGSMPQSPQQSLRSWKTKAGLTVDLVAANPLVDSPVAIDFGPDGRLWVAEMVDYPEGTRGDFKPGGRVRVLEDTDGDGVFDKATVFLDGIPFPTGITGWRKGVLVCAAPDILYAEDTTGGGKADKVETLYSGFGTHNYQGRVNSLAYGQDGWVHGSCGLFGGAIKSHRTGKVLNLGDRDFRIQPDTGAIEPATGRTQQGRARDDWGNWFGCDSGTLGTHLVLPDHYLRRNPHVLYPNPTAYMAEATKLFPARAMQLFQLSGPPGQPTAVCGLGVYRDDLLGAEYQNNLFLCEPVNMLVHRLRPTPRASTFTGKRAADEQDREMMASTDTWCRPVQVRTGPDGALWVVDMYRFVIEHPRWIPAQDLAKLDLRAGAGMGRIYRLRPSDKPLRKPARLDTMATPELVAAVDTANGTVRDLAGQMLRWRKDSASVEPLRKLATAGRPAARVEALAVLADLGQLTAGMVEKALGDADAGVRRHAVRLAEPFVATNPTVGEALLTLTGDADAQVRLQLACTLGEWPDPRAGAALGRLAVAHGKDVHLVAAVLSSVGTKNVADVLTAVLAEKEPQRQLVGQLLGLTAAVGDQDAVARTLRRLTEARDGRLMGWQYSALAGVLDALERRKLSAAALTDQVMAAVRQARALAEADDTADADRVAALALLGRKADEIDVLTKLLQSRYSPDVQAAALLALGRLTEDRVAGELVAGWKGYSPALRGQVLDALMARPTWHARLLTALEAKAIVPGQIDATRRQRLLTWREDKGRARAVKVFADLTTAGREQVLKEYAAALTLEGDVKRGKQVFAKHCSVCHQLEGVGHEVGPALWALVNKPAAYLLNEILDPNRNLDSRFQQYIAVTTRGQTFAGLLSSETATSIALRMQEGKQQVLLRADLEELTATGKSLMPEGLEKDMSKQDVADLLAYLSQQVKPGKQMAGNAPAKVTLERGQYALVAAKGEIRGGDIRFEEPFQNVGYWHGADDSVTWTVDVKAAGAYDVWLDYSCDNGVAGSLFVVESGKTPLRGASRGTGGWDRFEQVKLGEVALAAGVQKVVMRPDGRPRGALLDLRGVYLVPKGAKPVFGVAREKKAADPAALAKEILDDALSQERRQKLISDHPEIAAELIAAMTADLTAGTKEEYRRIPWVWRVAIAAGRRNEEKEMKKILDVSLPKIGGPLLDWQAVVIGGGVVNGISLAGGWPAERLAELVTDDAGRKKRWEQALAQAATMADNAKVPTGTRYDALRMIALDGWEKRGDQLVKYLAKGTDDELTMGAISGLADVRSPRVAAALLSGIDRYAEGNRKLAVEALLRTDDRALALLEAIAMGKAKKAYLNAAQVKALREHKDAKVSARAKAVLGD